MVTVSTKQIVTILSIHFLQLISYSENRKPALLGNGEAAEGQSTMHTIVNDSCSSKVARSGSYELFKHRPLASHLSSFLILVTVILR